MVFARSFAASTLALVLVPVIGADADGGDSWTPLVASTALPQIASLDSESGVVYAGTGGAGVARLTAADVTFCDGFESGDTSAW